MCVLHNALYSTNAMHIKKTVWRFLNREDGQKMMKKTNLNFIKNFIKKIIKKFNNKKSRKCIKDDNEMSGDDAQ